MNKIESFSFDELLKELKRLLKDNGLKFTAQREAILKGSIIKLLFKFTIHVRGRILLHRITSPLVLTI
jgi:hypothetical protein